MTNNSAPINGSFRDGGGVSARWGVSVIDSTVSNHYAGRGGGLYTQDGPMTILRSTIRDNTANGPGGGGAYKDGSTGTVVIAESTFSGNRNILNGRGANGGGLYSTVAIAVSDSTFTDNHTTRDLSAGGAIYASHGGAIVRSLFEDNSVAGRDSDGGAIWTLGNLTIDGSTFRNNSTNGQDGDGGAVHMSHGLVSNSTFVGNQTLGTDSDGGAIAYFGGFPISTAVLAIVNTTIVDNGTAASNSDGGGVYMYYDGNLDVRFSTIAGNRVQHATSRGGGIAFRDPTATTFGNGGITLWHSIVADNMSPGGNPDAFLRIDSLVSNYSLIESTAGLTVGQLAAINAGAGNLTGVDPLLAPIADNGGPTLTRALLPGSPALDAGDPAATFATTNLPRYDQRGFPYDRIAGARVDLGAVETQPTPAFADFDHDFDVDGADVLAWQRGLGTSAPDGTKAAGDADNDADVDADDLSIWQAQFGAPTTAATANATSVAEDVDALAISNSRADIDSLFAAGDFTVLFSDAKTTSRKLRTVRR